MQGVTCNLMICVLAVGLGTNFMFYNNTVGDNLAAVLQKFFNQSYVRHYDKPLTDTMFAVIYSITTTSLHVGALLSTFVLRIVAEKLGRRKTLIFTGLLQALGAVISGLSKLANSFEMFAVGRFVIGLGFGTGLGATSMLVSEIAPAKIRGAVGTAQQIFIGLGITTSFVVTLPQLLGTEALWPIAVTLPAILSLFQMFVMLWVHESPKYLFLTKGDRDAAIKSIEFYKGREAIEETLATFEIERDKQRNNIQLITFGQFLTKKIYRKYLIITIMVMFSVQFTGVSPVIAYANTIFTRAGFDALSAELATVGIGLTITVSPFITLFVIEKHGRRALFLSGLTITFLSALAMSILFGLSDRNSTILKLSILFVYLYYIGYTLSSSISWIMPAELFPQNVRSHNAAVQVFCSWIFQLINVLCYLPFEEAVGGVTYSMVPYLVLTVAGFIFHCICLPETKGVAPGSWILDDNSKKGRTMEEDQTKL